MPTSEQVRAAREALGESQAVFAIRFGVNQATIHRWETDGPPKRGPARKAVEDFLEAMAAKSEAAE